MGQFIRLAGLGALDSEVVVLAIVSLLAITSLVGLLIVRLTDPKREREKRKTHTQEELLRMVDKIEGADAELKVKDVKVLEMTHTAIKGDFGVDDDQDDEPPEVSGWLTRWMPWRR